MPYRESILYETGIEDMTQDVRSLRPRHIEAGVSGLIKSMVALAASDRKIDDREVSAIGTIFQDLTGQKLNLGEVRRAATAFRDEHKSISDMLVGIERDIDSEFKKTIVKACYLIGIADEILVRVELDDVRKVGNYLKLSPRTVDALIVEMEHRIQAEQPYH